MLFDLVAAVLLSAATGTNGTFPFYAVETAESWQSGRALGSDVYLGDIRAVGPTKFFMPWCFFYTSPTTTHGCVYQCQAPGLSEGPLSMEKWLIFVVHLPPATPSVMFRCSP